MTRAFWTASEDKTLVKMTDEGHQDALIANRLGRTITSIRERRRHVNGAFPPDTSKVKPRKCLKCYKKFNSQGPGNRICTGCTSRASRSVYDPTIRNLIFT